MLKYSDASVVFQEVPGEISLAISVSGCPLKCKGCHSAHTRNPTLGEVLDKYTIDDLLEDNKHITCILFYGGEWAKAELIEMLEYIQLIGIKTCLYTGREEEEISYEIKDKLDYIKVGPYIEELGGLGSPTTNQKFIKL